MAFHWGVVLQLGDDLQDVHSDLARGSRTLFTSASRSEPLDTTTNRVFHFSERALREMDRTAKASAAFLALLKSSSRLLLIRSAAAAAPLYTPEYLSRLDNHSPLRFGFLQSRERRFAKRQRACLRLFVQVSSSDERAG